ncbi:polyphosphate:AMP phosphotransferase, partial [Cyanobacterium stanieri LEGE 03274]|nr:polyphosphate:AMP phosphotransferase [Cyanobacterium stanieri LEGE 03274]
MLNTLDLNLSLDKKNYHEQIEALMIELRSLQNTCWQQKIPIIVVLEGWAAAGKGKIVQKITNYMDPRGFDVYPTLAPTTLEQKYP